MSHSKWVQWWLEKYVNKNQIIDIEKKETNKLDLDTVYELIDCDMVEVCSYFSLLEKNNNILY